MLYTQDGKIIQQGGKLASAQVCCCTVPGSCCINQILQDVEDTSGYTQYSLNAEIQFGVCVNVACEDCSKGFTVEGQPGVVYGGACKEVCATPCIEEPPPICCCGAGGCFPIDGTQGSEEKCEAQGGTVLPAGSLCGPEPYGQCTTTWENTGACCYIDNGTPKCFVTTECECNAGADYAGQPERDFLGPGTTCESCCPEPKHLCGTEPNIQCCEENEYCCGEGEGAVCCPAGQYCCNGVCQPEPCSCEADEDCPCSPTYAGCGKCSEGTCDSYTIQLRTEFDRSFGMGFPELCCVEANSPGGCANGGTPTGRCDCGMAGVSLGRACEKDIDTGFFQVLLHECPCDECPVITGWPLDKYPVIPSVDWEFACRPRNSDGSCPPVYEFTPCDPP